MTDICLFFSGDHVYRFDPALTTNNNNASVNFLKVLAQDSDSLLVGGRNALFNLSAADLAENVHEVGGVPTRFYQ